MPENLDARLFTVSGMVQGVGFRFFVERVAARLDLRGYVKNLRDGRVEVYAIGAQEQIAQLAQELARGPRAASVSGVTQEKVALLPRYARDFSIEHDDW